MVSTFLKRTILVGALALLTTNCSNQSNPSTPSVSNPEQPTGDTIVVGDISDEPAKKIEEYQPFADYLAAELDIDTGAVTIAPDMETMAKWLASGKVDVYFDSPYPSMIVSNLSGAKPILRRWKDGVSAYNTIIFTRSDSGIKTLDDLKGEMVAFEEPFSTSGYMLPLTHLLEAGLTPSEKADADANVTTDEVGYVFSEDDENTIQWALAGRVSAAAVGAPAFLEIPEDVRQQLTVLAETEPLPRHMVLLSPSLSNQEATNIKTTLLAMDEAESGQSVLMEFEETAQFDEFPEGLDQALGRMRELYELTQKQ